MELDDLAASSVHSYITRFRENGCFSVPKVKGFGKTSFAYHEYTTWNALPANIKNIYGKAAVKYHLFNYMIVICVPKFLICHFCFQSFNSISYCCSICIFYVCNQHFIPVLTMLICDTEINQSISNQLTLGYHSCCRFAGQFVGLQLLLSVNNYIS